MTPLFLLDNDAETLGLALDVKIFVIHYQRYFGKKKRGYCATGHPRCTNCTLVLSSAISRVLVFALLSSLHNTTPTPNLLCWKLYQNHSHVIKGTFGIALI